MASASTVTVNETASPVVFVVEDDISMRKSLLDLFQSMKIQAAGFESAADFLAGANHAQAGCILLDVRLPGVSGLDFQEQLGRMGSRMPIVFMTGFGDIAMTVRAMKAGAIDFLTKPFRDQDVLDAVVAAIQRDQIRRRHSAESEAVASLIDALTPRELEVMNGVAKGMLNKQIAFELSISEITVKLHRGNLMKKMEVKSVADLVRKLELVAVRE